MGALCCPNTEGIFQPMSEEIITLNSQYNDIKINYLIYYDDIELLEKYISNYKTYVTELNYQLSDLNDKLNIAYSNPEDNNQNINNVNSINENTYLLNNLDEINNKINIFHSLLEKQKAELKNLENHYRNIQEQYNEIKKKLKKGKSNNSNSILNKINLIQKQLDENTGIMINLKDNQKEYYQMKTEIEDYLKNMQKTTKEKLEKIKSKRKYIESNDNHFKSDNLFSNSSLLLDIEDFTTVKDKVKIIYSSKNKVNNDDTIELPKLLMKNWCEICYIYDDYDLHDIIYKLKFISQIQFSKANSSFFDFLSLYLNSNSENHDYHPDLIFRIENFEINGKKSNYEYSNNTIKFKILLENFETAKIHIKYKEFIKYNEKKEAEEKIFSKISRSKLYGLSKRLSGEDAKYILKNESNLEIINFSNEFLIETNNNEYQWRGIVPDEGKKTKIRMSKKEGIINFENILKIKTFDNSNIKQTILEVPFSCIGGNNYLNNLVPYSDQTKEINIDKKKRVYNIKFININKNSAEFHIKAEFKNFYKEGWNIDLTKEEIDSLIPPDYITNKLHFNKVANEIIKQYDEEHKDDPIKIKDIVKIGKWVNKNIKYNKKYAQDELTALTATETLNLKEGVCDHITKLFNALMYSLGYQVIYVNGYVMDKKNTFDENDIHAWSLINIEGKWLPFDATYGIFSGKLPVTHVYHKIGNKGAYIIEELSDEKSFISSFSVKGKIS